MGRRSSLTSEQRTEAVLCLLRREAPAAKVARRLGISEPTPYRSRSRLNWLFALVAALPAFVAAPTIAGTRLPEPIPVEFRTIDGRDVQGRVEACDDLGLDGSFGRIQWKDLPAAEAWHVHAAIIDPSIAEHWLSVGRVLACLEGGQVHAERALRWARWLGQYTADAAAQTIAELAPTPDGFVPPHPRAHARDAGPFEPWPVMAEVEQAAAVVELKAQVDAGLKRLGLTMLLYEQPFALVYSDMPQSQVEELLEGLHATHETLLRSFRLAPGSNPFWGKAVVVMCKEQATFQRIMRELMHSSAPPEMAGVHVPDGPRAFLLLWDYPDRAKLRATVPHEYTHAFVHRLRSPAPMPLWLDEGFADFVASLVHVDSPVDQVRRERGEWFVRHGGPIDNIMDMRCMHDGWPGPFASAYGVSYLLVHEMFREGAPKALACIAAIKGGKPWERALAEDLGVTRATLVERVVASVKERR